jgi:hypothetical protein
MTLTEVASALTRNPASVRRWETGRAMPPRHCLIALGRLYHRAPAELID